MGFLLFRAKRSNKAKADPYPLDASSEKFGSQSEGKYPTSSPAAPFVAAQRTGASSGSGGGDAQRRSPPPSSMFGMGMGMPSPGSPPGNYGSGGGYDPYYRSSMGLDSRMGMMGNMGGYQQQQHGPMMGNFDNNSNNTPLGQGSRSFGPAVAPYEVSEPSTDDRDVLPGPTSGATSGTFPVQRSDNEVREIAKEVAELLLPQLRLAQAASPPPGARYVANPSEPLNVDAASLTSERGRPAQPKSPGPPQYERFDYPGSGSGP